MLNLKVSAAGTASLLYLICTLNVSFAQIKKQEIAELADQEVLSALDSFKEFLSIPNNASYPDHVSQNVAWCRDAFSPRGFEIMTLDTGGHPF